MLELPAELKSLGSVAARANELELVEPAVSYWSRYWIVQKSMELQKTQRSPKVEEYLLYVLDELEAMKSKHAGMIELESLANGKVKVEAFALQVFDNADREEKARNATRGTSSKFLAAATFLEVCQVFGQPEKELVDKRKYAKVQAMRIQSAIAAGKDPNTRKITPKGQAAGSAPTAAESAELDALMAQPPSTVQVGVKSSPGSPDVSAVDSVTQLPMVGSASLSSSDEITSNPYFPADKDLEVFSPQIPDRPTRETNDVDQQAVLFTQKEQEVRSNLAPPQDVVVPVDADAVANAQKHAKWAISALNYEDVTTAISELKLALDCLATSA